VGRSGIAIVVAALMISGCGAPVARAPAPGQRDLVFDFRLTSKPGVMDQVLLIGNWDRTGVAPVLALTALDANADPMPDVTVHTAYGSDKGKVVVPPRATVIDVLRFEGPGARDVEDVDVEVTASEEIPRVPTGGELTVEHLDHRGRPVDLAAYIHGYRVTNDSDAEAKARVVLIEWENPPAGEPQQALRVTPVSPLLTLAPHAKKTVRLPRALRGNVIGTVKAYYSR
jgi:hypothetical protein